MAPGTGATRGRGVTTSEDAALRPRTQIPALVLDPIRSTTYRLHQHICPVCGLYGCRQRPCQAGDCAFCVEHVPGPPRAPEPLEADLQGRLGSSAGDAAYAPVHLRATEPVAWSVVGGIVLAAAWIATACVLAWLAS